MYRKCHENDSLRKNEFNKKILEISLEEDEERDLAYKPKHNFGGSFCLRVILHE